MKAVIPILINDSNMTNNITITETLWTAGTYTLGAKRYKADTYIEYEVIVASTSDEPVFGTQQDPPTWKKVGVINKYRMFDGLYATQSSRTSPIEVVVESGSNFINAVAVLGISDAEFINISVEDTLLGVVYDKTVQLIDNSEVVDWWNFFYSPYELKTEIVFIDLPFYNNVTVTVTLTGEDVVKCGEILMGRVFSLGQTQLYSGLGIVDFSKKERDDEGNFSLEERTYVKRIDYDVQVDRNRVASVNNFLTKYRATPTVWIGEESAEETIIYGFFRDFEIVLSSPTICECNISVEGL